MKGFCVLTLTTAVAGAVGLVALFFTLTVIGIPLAVPLWALATTIMKKGWFYYMQPRLAHRQTVQAQAHRAARRAELKEFCQDIL